MRKIKINLAKSAGFCFGVKRALDIAFKSVNSPIRVSMLGDIVHNEDVVKEIERTGIKKIKRLTPGKNKILLIRAHGEAKATIEKARRLGYQVIDATCPMVKEIHKIVRRMEKRGYKIIVIGDKNHDEVKGIAGQLKNQAVIIEGINDIDLRRIKKIKKGCVVAQSTQNLEKVLKIVGLLKLHIPGLRFFNTICKPTRIKQDEIRGMPLTNDVMLILGSKNSANTRRLYEISKSLNNRTFWIPSKDQIKLDWFKNAKTIGITAGASTPDSTTAGVINYLKSALLP